MKLRQLRNVMYQQVMDATKFGLRLSAVFQPLHEPDKNGVGFFDRVICMLRNRFRDVRGSDC